MNSACEIQIDIPLLTVNQAWAGRRFKTPAYKKYEEELLIRLPKLACIKGEVVVSYWFYVKNFRRDVSNMIKPLEDILVKHGVIEDDRKIICFTATKVKSQREGFRVEINPYE